MSPMTERGLFARHRLTPFTIITKPQGQCYCSHFTDKKTKAQRLSCVAAGLERALADFKAKPQSRPTWKQTAEGLWEGGFPGPAPASPPRPPGLGPASSTSGRAHSRPL